MSETKILDMIEDLYTSNYESDSEIDNDFLDSLIAACEVELRERDSE